MKYSLKSDRLVDAVQWDGFNSIKILNFCGVSLTRELVHLLLKMDVKSWLLKDADGEFSIMSDNEFREKYEVNGIPMSEVFCEFCQKTIDREKLHVSTGTGYAHEDCWGPK